VRPIETPWVLPDRTIERAEQADREIRMSDFALMAVLPFRTLEVSSVPVNELAMAALVGLCLFRRARGGALLPGPAVALFGALLVFMVGSGLANDEGEWLRRVGHLVILAGLVWALGTCRVSVRSAAVGLAAGLISVIGLALLGIGGDTYPGRLTGFLDDPNAGAFFISVLGIIAIFFSDPRRAVRLAIAVPIVVGLTLCYSRTGLLAGGFAIAWLLLGRKLGLVGGVLMAAGLVWLVDNIPDDVVTFGPFSNRTGSDKLRERIIAQEYVQLSDMPWYGHGPGTAKVEVQGVEFFFHNSYLATRQEGGWLALMLVLALMVYAFVGLSHRSREGDLTAAGAQAALLATAVMGITLGEVLLDTPMAIAVGMALAQSRWPASTEPPDG
jgi:O-antigen ligase